VLQEAKKAYPERWGSRETRRYLVSEAEILNPAKDNIA
jgi:hypothetical protein